MRIRGFLCDVSLILGGRDETDRLDVDLVDGKTSLVTVKSGVTALSFTTDVLAKTNVVPAEVFRIRENRTLIETVVFVTTDAWRLHSSCRAILNGVDGSSVDVSERA